MCENYSTDVAYFTIAMVVAAIFFAVMYYGLNAYLDYVGRKWRREHGLPEWDDDWHQV